MNDKILELVRKKREREKSFKKKADQKKVTAKRLQELVLVTLKERSHKLSSDSLRKCAIINSYFKHCGTVQHLHTLR